MNKMEIIEIAPCSEKDTFHIHAELKEDIEIAELYLYIKKSIRYEKIGLLDTTKTIWFFRNDFKVFINESGKLLICHLKNIDEGKDLLSEIGGIINKWKECRREG